MEMIFGHSVGNQRNLRYDDPDSADAFIAKLIDDAVDFENSYLMWAREENMRYYYGQMPEAPSVDDAGNPVGRSSVVSSDVRDTIMTILPSLVRIFLGAEYPVQYTPRSEAEEEGAAEATDYIHYLFREEWDGFLLLYTIIKDCLVNRGGFAKCWTETVTEVVEREYQNISMEQYQLLIYENPTLEVLEMGEVNPRTGLIEYIVCRWETTQPITKAKAIKPEDFRISRNATSAKTAQLIGSQEVVPISDFVKEGYDYDEIAQYASESRTQLSEESRIREPALSDSPAFTDGVLRGEYFIRVDYDGDGIDELRYIKTVGDNHVILENYIVEHSNIAVFLSDIRPHTALGECITDLGKDIQVIKTNVLRSVMDNMVEVVNPKMVVNELLTNIEDALNDEVGAVIRTRGDPTSAVHYSRPEFIGAESKVVLDYLDQIRASRTGITEASKGLDPGAMQSTALSGINAIVSGAQERIEIIALCIANTGFRDLFRVALREITQNPAPERQVKISGKWRTINVSTFDPNMTVQVNPSLGKGTDQIRMSVLAMIMEKQEMIISKFGRANPVVTPDEYMNTVEDMLTVANIRNFSRYFKRMSPEQLQAMYSTPEEPSPESVLAQAQMEKVKADTAKAIAGSRNDQQKLEFQKEKLAVDDDFRRDKLNVDAAVAGVQALQGAQEQIARQQEVETANTPDGK